MSEPYQIDCAAIFSGHDSLRTLSPQFAAEKLEAALEDAALRTLAVYDDAHLILYCERGDAGMVAVLLDGLYGKGRPFWNIRQRVTVRVRLLFRDKTHKRQYHKRSKSRKTVFSRIEYDHLDAILASVE